jgi:C4-dicarboxylate-specific signal transduction histidine kinase
VSICQCANWLRLKGFDDKWIKVPANRRQAAYTNLRPGNYTFELRYAPDGKQWLEEMAELHIAVSPYFYKTIWFILSILVLLSFLIYKVLSWRLRSLKEQQEMFHIKVEERTRELEEQKKLLRARYNIRPEWNGYRRAYLCCLLLPESSVFHWWQVARPAEILPVL